MRGSLRRKRCWRKSSNMRGVEEEEEVVGTETTTTTLIWMAEGAGRCT
jgi:hypothetical protein